MDILDDQETRSNNYIDFLFQDKFLKRIRFFSIISLINSIFLACISIGLLVYSLIASPRSEIIITLCFSGFAQFGGFLLFKTYRFSNQFIKNPTSQTHALSKSIQLFFFFWLAFISCFLLAFLLMIIFL